MGLPPALDLEQDKVGLSFAKAWLEHIKGLSGRTPIIYTSPNFWNNLRDSANATWAVEYPLWIANYFSALTFPVYDIPDQVANSISLPLVPEPWKKKGKTWTIWQYCATGDGEFYGGNYAKHTDRTGLDLNVFNGSLEDLYKFCESGSVPPQLPQSKYVVITANFLRFRPTPEYKVSTTLIVERNQILEVAGSPVYEGASGIMWLPVKYPIGYAEGIAYISANSNYIREIY